EPGYERALAAALGGRLSAAIVDDLTAGGALLDRAGGDGGRVLIAGPGRASSAPGSPPAPNAVALGDLLSGAEAAVALARRLLADTWVVEHLGGLPAGFTGVAVTRTGRAWFGSGDELRQAPRGGSERVLAERNRRDALIGES